MQNWITHVIEQFGYIGVFFMIALENIFPPIPSEVILTFGGMMTSFSKLTVLGVILASTAGSVFGAAVLFKIGTFLDVPRLERIVERWGHLLRLKKEDIHKADNWFDRYGYWAVFFCRLVPLIRSLISIPAGMSGMKFSLFLLFTTLGTLIWNTILVYVGAAFGRNWEQVVHFMDIYSNVMYALLAAALGLFVFYYVKKKRRQ
ncbi:DedA family protein [Fictibacillus fluitans]|uniref:DedA family protein n=1 Tax=Fictibacillus fluitans TaxID=3058422 RepID=A0ABT8HZ16_9BACL|nr:DedA family protein [Fictibacillus sp. NE201]MDN4525710.1 DedA family protein [Fictibacillus sp. NE201]